MRFMLLDSSLWGQIVLMMLKDITQTVQNQSVKFTTSLHLMVYFNRSVCEVNNIYLYFGQESYSLSSLTR